MKIEMRGKNVKNIWKIFNQYKTILTESAIEICGTHTKKNSQKQTAWPTNKGAWQIPHFRVLI